MLKLGVPVLYFFIFGDDKLVGCSARETGSALAKIDYNCPTPMLLLLQFYVGPIRFLKPYRSLLL